MSSGFVLLLGVMLAVLIVLGLGIFSMLKGGEFNKKYGNRLMVARVSLQAVAIALLLLLAMGGR